LAFDVYIHRLLREIGGMLAVLGGVDALIFTAGVGENSPAVRERVCECLAFLGLKIDLSLNNKPKLDQDIATTDSKVRVLVIRANEELQIAKECHRLLSAF
jgi:acetate kinase